MCPRVLGTWKVQVDRAVIRGCYCAMEGLLDGKLHERDVMVTVSAECTAALVALARCAEQVHAQTPGMLFTPLAVDLVCGLILQLPLGASIPGVPRVCGKVTVHSLLVFP